MSVPPTNAEADAAVPAAATPSRPLTNQFLKDLIATYAALVSGAASDRDTLAEIGAILDLKANILTPQTISATENLAATRMNRSLRIDHTGASFNVVLQTDASGLYSNDDTFDGDQINTGPFVLTAAGGVTLTIPSGCTADSSLAAGGVVLARRVAANTWKVLSRLASAGGGAGDFNRVVNDLTNYLVPDNTTDNQIATFAIGALAAGDSLKIRVIMDAVASGALQNATVKIRINSTEVGGKNDGGGSNNTDIVARHPLDIDILSATTVWGNLGQKDGDIGGATFAGSITTVSSMASATTLAVHVQKSATGRTTRVRGIFVDVVKA